MRKQATLSIPWALSLGLLSAALPLTVYAVSLALFGIPHIYAELSYIKDRFYAQMSALFIIVNLGLLLIVCVCATIMVVKPFHFYAQIMLALFAILLLSSLWLKQSVPNLILLLSAYILMALFQPLLVLLALAFLHNLAPWLFKRAQYAALFKSDFYIVALLCFRPEYCVECGCEVLFSACGPSVYGALYPA